MNSRTCHWPITVSVSHFRHLIIQVCKISSTTYPGLLFDLPGSGDSSVVRVPDSWSKGHAGSNPCRSGRGTENYLVQGQLSLISVSVPPPVFTAVERKRPPVILPKVLVVADQLQVNTHAPYVSVWLCTKWHQWCMVVWCTWCTQNAPRWQQFHVSLAMPAV